MNIVEWAEVRDQIKDLNPSLFKIIEAMSPERRMSFVRVGYRYGDLIVNNGIFQVPNAAEAVVPLGDSSLPPEVHKKLAYSVIPLGILLNKGIEIFADANGVTPLNYLVAGRLFGVFEVLNLFDGHSTRPNWSVSAGARSTFLLTKVSEKNRHFKLRRKFPIPDSPPLNLADHWRIFQGIAKSEPKPFWTCEILFFSKEWFALTEEDNSWLKFQNFLYRKSWEQSLQHREQVVVGLWWKQFALQLEIKGLKPRPYLADTVKHLVAIARGAAPCFAPADQYEHALPSHYIQEAYIDVYGLRDYLPTIMHLTNLYFAGKTSGYYSLSYPTLIAGVESGRNFAAILTDMRDLKVLIDTLLAPHTFMDDSEIKPILGSQVNFEYYHSERDNFRDVSLTQELVERDHSFLLDEANYPGRSFCYSSSFLRGCIRVCSPLARKKRLDVEINDQQP